MQPPYTRTQSKNTCTQAKYTRMQAKYTCTQPKYMRMQSKIIAPERAKTHTILM
jgi:hypothetical protein